VSVGGRILAGAMMVRVRFRSVAWVFGFVLGAGFMIISSAWAAKNPELKCWCAERADRISAARISRTAVDTDCGTRDFGATRARVLPVGYDDDSPAAAAPSVDMPGSGSLSAVGVPPAQAVGTPGFPVSVVPTVRAWRRSDLRRRRWCGTA
jgi:hypothetical protein